MNFLLRLLPIIFRWVWSWVKRKEQADTQNFVRGVLGPEFNVVKTGNVSQGSEMKWLVFPVDPSPTQMSVDGEEEILTIAVATTFFQDKDPTTQLMVLVDGMAHGVVGLSKAIGGSIVILTNRKEQR